MKRLPLLALTLAMLCCGPALAAVTPNSIVTVQTPTRALVQFLQGTDSAGTYKTLYTAGTNGSRCNALWMTNSEASQQHLVSLEIVNGGVSYVINSLQTIAGAGFVNAVTPQSISAPGVWPGLPKDSDGNNYIQLVSGDVLKATFATAFSTTGAVINVVGSCADF